MKLALVVIVSVICVIVGATSLNVEDALQRCRVSTDQMTEEVAKKEKEIKVLEEGRCDLLEKLDMCGKIAIDCVGSDEDDTNTRLWIKTNAANTE